MSRPRIGALFAGYGGLDQAVEAVTGAELAWYSEIDKGACKILAHRYPGVPNIGDVTKADWSQVEPVDIITGGSPCQDLSHAGKRAGMTEGTRSNLWVAMREAIAQLHPSLVVWENVRGAYSASADSDLEFCAGCMGDAWDREPVLRALGRVLGDFVDLGFDAEWTGLRAADVGAPHGRFRVFVTAYPAGHPWWLEHGDGEAASDSRRGGHPRRTQEPLRRSVCGVAVAWSGTLFPTPRATDGTKGGPNQRGSSGDLMLPSAVTLLPTPEASRAGGTPERHLQRKLDADGSVRTAVTNLDILAAGASTDWGVYADAIARWESLTRPAPPPTQLSEGYLRMRAKRLARKDTRPVGRRGSLAPARQLSARFSEWMMGLPDGWVTDVPGITRNEALKALGNGVVPQQAIAALVEILGAGRAAA